ncbi:MAG: family 10 glycosylhydrolase [Rhodothermales bacterium]|nr:family 10 glycosylhydrolase [Rhodothermales bacterium]
MEIVENYDVDAVHFDFIRYPQGGLPDDGTSFQFDDRGFEDIGDWRRDNITQFVRSVSSAIWQDHPWVKIGSAPFGNYENFDGAWPASWALTDVFQESRVWLSDGIHDYVAPQIYFDIGREPEPPNTYDSPDFAYLVDDWVSNSAGKPVFIGHGPYKSVVLEELDTQVTVTRTGTASGQFFFRYDHIKQYAFETAYPTPALPAQMRHRFEATPPDRPLDLLATPSVENGQLTVALDWRASSGTSTDPLRGYAIFRDVQTDPFTGTGDNLVDFVWGDRTSYTDQLAINSSYFYQVVAVSRLGILSLPSSTVSNVPLALEDRMGVDTPLRIESVHPNPTTDQLTVSYRGSASSPVSVSVIDLVGRTVLTSESRTATNGLNTLLLDVRSLAAGLYRVTLQSSSGFASEPFVVLR